jgi:hypothetical protein
MKHKLIFLLASAMVLTLIGCSVVENNEPIVNTDPSFPEFYIGGYDRGSSESDTKVSGSWDNPGAFFTWTYNDRVAIYPGVNIKVEYVYEGDTGETKGVLKAVAGGDYTFGGDPIEYNVAVVPYHKDRVNIVESRLYLDIPQTQVYSYNSIGDGQFYMVDITEPETRNLHFKSIGAYYTLTLSNPTSVDQPVYKIELVSLGSELLWGKHYIDIDPSGDIDYTAKHYSGGSNYLILDVSGEEGGHVTIPAGESRDFYFFLPAQNYSNGLSFKVYYSSSSYNYYNYNISPLNAQRNFGYSGNFDYSPISAPVEPTGYVSYLLNNFDTNYDGELSDSEAEAVSAIEISQSVSGFDAQEPGYELSRFKNLTSLSVQSPTDSKTDVLDLTSFRSLTTLIIENDYDLKSVKFAGGPNAALENVTLRNLQSLDDFDFRDLKGLRYLYVSNCDKLTKPDFSFNEKVTDLRWINTEVTSLDLRAMKNLEYLACYYNYNLAEIRIPRSKALYHIDIESARALEGELDLSYYTNLQGSVYLNDNKLTNIILPKVEHSENLTLYVSQTSIRSLDVSGVSGNIQRLYAYNCPNLESIDLDGCGRLYNISVYNNPILKSLDITECRDYDVDLKLYGCPECESLTLIEDQLSSSSRVDDHIEWIYE